ncbi:Major facilitator superfamily MFS_1 [Nitrosococcus oceani ATCC 19707]|uniref:Major facilitator superfamily MFS_1 n=2 Tax=Nitrosococcus oceani TaxID=1229 RepID=Q3JAW5_NITOC|nr:MFS transporter [Nitrosococcus oceani]ABA58031.1 Major facilitator superfamily MFS_1 [Nitrosococcus oceani ATCC 19707]EDZ67948.1 transporter, major facilitator family [Nitrosococcus oceani AFC27]KFI19554.1 MFS transporter [Nitrosococcus oceani C-27]GEM21009.1 MFS transporter [Nitrosococcus oceani]
MQHELQSISSLLFGIAIVLLGSGLLGTLVGVQANQEQFSSTVIGFIQSAFFLGYVLGTFLCPLLIKRVGHIRVFATMAALGSATAMGFALWVHPLWWVLLRMVLGISVVGLYMVVESWLNEQSSHHSRGRVFAIYMSITLMALGFSQFLLLIEDNHGFIRFALTAVLFSLALIPVALTQTLEPKPISAPRSNLKELYLVSPLGVVGALVAGLASGAFWGMGAVFAQNIGLSVSSTSVFMSTVIFGGALLLWPVGYLSDRWDRRRVLIMVSFTSVASVLGAALVLDASTPMLLLLAFLYGGVSFSVYALAVAHLNDHLKPGEVLEATRGILLVYGAGSALGPLIAGFCMAVWGPSGLLDYLAAILALLGLFGLYRTQRSAPIPAEEQGEFVPMIRTSQAVLEMYPEADLEPELDLALSTDFEEEAEPESPPDSFSMDWDSPDYEQERK